MRLRVFARVVSSFVALGSVSSLCTAQAGVATGAPSVPQTALAAGETHSCPRLIEFSGEQADPADLKFPNVSGRVLIYYWSELEPKEGKFDFSAMDREVATWTSAGKAVVLRLSAAGWTKWKEPWSQQGTPEWAYKKYRISRVVEVDGAILPVYWDEGFQAGLREFLRAVAGHIRTSSYRDKVAFVEIAAGDGGETKPDTEQNKTPEQRAARLALWQEAGYTNALWYQAIRGIVASYKAAFPSTPVALMPDASFLGGECTLSGGECNERVILALAKQEGLALQDNGFDRTHLYPAEWHGGPLACEQRQSATQMGYPLEDDLEQSVKADCAWLLVFRQDLQRPDFQRQVENFYQRCEAPKQ
ncbi:MAG TPA: beta-galactosidase [Acidobacteriaceae bacterium]